MVNQKTQESNFRSDSLGELAGNTISDIPNSTFPTSLKYSQSTTLYRFQPSNTYDSSQSAFFLHLDYLSFSLTNLPQQYFETLLQYLDSKYLTREENKYWSIGSKAKSYKNRLTSPRGIQGGYTYQNETLGYKLMIVLEGSYFANVSVLEQQKLLSSLKSIYNVKVHRIDLAIDDYSYQRIPIDEMVEAWSEKNIFHLEKYYDPGSGTDVDNFRKTHYFGAPGSKKRVRVYDHEGECLRFETQFRHECAMVVLEEIANLERTTDNDEDWEREIQTRIGGLAVGVVDFRDRSRLKNPKKASVDKTKRLPFYQKFIQEIGREIRVKPKTNGTINQTLEPKFKWLETKVAKLLALAYLALGEGYIWKLIELGLSKLSPEDYQKIEYWQDQNTSS